MKAPPLVWTAWALGVGLLLVAIGAPSVALLARVGDADAVATLPGVRAAALHSAGLAVLVPGLAALVGVPLGLLLGRVDLPGRTRWLALATVPATLPPFVLALAWVAVLEPRSGLLGPALGLSPWGWRGIVAVLTLEAVPVLMWATVDATDRLDPTLREAARVAGARPWAVLLQVDARLASPAIVEAMAWTSASALAAFGVPYLLGTGTPRPTPVLTTAVAQVLDLDPRNGQADAAAIGLLLVAMAGVPWGLRHLLLRRWVGRGRAAQVGPRLHLGRWTGLAAAPVALWVGITTGLPLLALVRLAADPTAWARALDPTGRSALALSFGLAVATAVVAVPTGALLAWATHRTDWRGRGLGRALAVLPTAVPGTVLALGVLLAASQPLRWILADRLTLTLAPAGTVWLLGAATIVRHLAIPVTRCEAALAALPTSWDEAATVAGAGATSRFTTLAWPLLAPELRRSALLVFIPALSEVTVSVLLAGPSTRVVGVVLFDRLTYGDPPAAAVLAVLLAAAALATHAALAGHGERHGGLG